MNSRRKGADGERALAKKLRELGFDARRGAQYHGGPDSPDVVGIPGYHIECKRYKDNLNIYKAMEQAERDCGGNIPIVFSRKDREKWLVTMRDRDRFLTEDFPVKSIPMHMRERINLYKLMPWYGVLRHAREGGELLVTFTLETWSRYGRVQDIRSDGE